MRNFQAGENRREYLVARPSTISRDMKIAKAYVRGNAKAIAFKFGVKVWVVYKAIKRVWRIGTNDA